MKQISSQKDPLQDINTSQFVPGSGFLSCGDNNQEVKAVYNGHGKNDTASYTFLSLYYKNNGKPLTIEALKQCRWETEKSSKTPFRRVGKCDQEHPECIHCAVQYAPTHYHDGKVTGWEFRLVYCQNGQIKK